MAAKKSSKKSKKKKKATPKKKKKRKTSGKKKKKTKSKSSLKASANTDEHFVLLDGRTLQNIMDLAIALENMEDHVFGHHVNSNRNDFANWIRHVMRDGELAEHMSNAKHKNHASWIIYRHVAKKLW